MPKPETALLTHVRVSLTGSLPPKDVVVSILGVAPDQEWRKGDVVWRGAVEDRRTEDACFYTVTVEQQGITPDPGEAVFRLLSRFPDLSAFRRFGETVEMDFVLGVTGYKTRPYASVPPAALRQLADAGLTLYIDFYDLSDVTESKPPSDDTSDSE